MSTPSLKRRLAGPRPITAPGTYDALTASLAEAAGFEAAYVSGAAVAYTLPASAAPTSGWSP